MGEKWSEKERTIYGVQNYPVSSWGFNREEVTDIILTHLHFDHAGGISIRDAANNTQLAFPTARIHLQRANWEHAQSPSIKERASYLPENVQPLRDANLLLCDGDVELFPDLMVHRVDGHTRGQQWIEIQSPDGVLYYPTDLMPTSHHISLPYHMGYDLCAETLLKEKAAFLEMAVQRGAIVVFEHDVDVVAGTIARNEKGGFGLGELVDIA